MEIDKNEVQNEINKIEEDMLSLEFWADKKDADEKVKRLKRLKAKLIGEEDLLKGNAIINIIAGAGGDDSEDFAKMLYEMYSKFLNKINFNQKVLHSHYNDLNGVKNITIEVSGDYAYGDLKNESGVHRLVRVSPFNAASKRHTSFALVEVLPVLQADTQVEIDNNDIEIITQKGGGPGGQNVNKRETSVRILHIPTNISVHVSAERTQEANKEKALKLLQSKLYKLAEENIKKENDGYKLSKVVDIEWGSQIRNYVMNPYKLVKDLRTGVSTTEIDKVLSGDIEAFINAGKEL